MEQKNAVISHKLIGIPVGREIYILKFKDRSNKQGIQIKNDDKAVMKLAEINISKVPRENNMIQVELVKIL